MNSRHMFLIVVIVLLGFYIPTKIQQNSINSVETMSRQYDEMLVNATSDATYKLLEATDSYSNEVEAEGIKIDYRNINLNLDAALDRLTILILKEKVNNGQKYINILMHKVIWLYILH